MTDLMRMNRKVYEFEGEWQEASDNPSRAGFGLYGARAATADVLCAAAVQAACRYGKVAYDSLEEGSSLTMQNALVRVVWAMWAATLCC